MNLNQSGRSTNARHPSWRSRLATRCFRVIGRCPIPVPTGWAPTFLIGCGRSGTTILGTVLHQHHKVHVSNEPRYLWRAINPNTDIWYALPGQPPAGGKLSMTPKDATHRDRIVAARLFRFLLLRHRRNYLVEKLPINSFRVGYLRTLFPNCRIIHIVRHGLEVAHSIARTGDRWYAPNDGQKWRLLSEYARQLNYAENIIADCTSHLAKGLIEWTLSVDSAVQSLKDVPKSDQITVRYEELLADPSATIQSLEEFLGWPADIAVHDYAKCTLTRRNKSARELEMPTPTCDRTHELLTELRYD